jgi:hypothetical protein
LPYQQGSRRAVLAACAVLYAAAWFVVGLLPLPGTDLDKFFRPSAEAMLRHPLLPYAAAGQAAYPNANGPLALLPLALVVGALRTAGIDPAAHVGRALTLALFSPFILLVAREAMRAVDTHRASPLGGLPRLLAYASLTLAPVVFQGGAGYGHVEQPLETWLVLLAARWVLEQRPGRAGAAVGLAGLARSPALLFILPLALAARRTGWRNLGLLLVGAVAAAGAGILPFLLSDPGDVVHSLVTYRGSLLVGVGSIWTLTRGTPLEPLAQHADAAFIVAAVIISTSLLAARRDGLAGARLYAALALAATSFALLAKTVWPYYMVEVYLLAMTWALCGATRASPGVRAALAGVILAVAGMAEVGATPGVPVGIDRIEGAASFMLLLGVGAVILRSA